MGHTVNCLIKFKEYLKVVGNEKKRWVKIFTVVGHKLGTVAINVHFHFDVPFAIEKCISFSPLSSKINRPFV